MSRIEVYKEDTYETDVTVTDGDDAIFNLTGYTMVITAKVKDTDTTPVLLSTASISTTSAAAGVGVISLSKTDTELYPYAYVYNIRIYNATKSHIIARDLLEIKQN